MVPLGRLSPTPLSIAFKVARRIIEFEMLVVADLVGGRKGVPDLVGERKVVPLLTR